MAKIWRNRIEAGTQKLADCPRKYRSSVIALIRADIENGDYTIEELQKLVDDGMMTQEEFDEITDGLS